MKSLVVYDSYFGNTEKVAETIAKELGEDSKVIRISDLEKKDLKGIDLLVLGSPIRGWQPSENTKAFLDSLDSKDLEGVKATAFDTRVKLFIHGDAMNKMAKKLKSVGAEIAVAPQAFYVSGQEGPLLDGELEKAAEWAKSIISKL